MNKFIQRLKVRLFLLLLCEELPWTRGAARQLLSRQRAEFSYLRRKLYVLT